LSRRSERRRKVRGVRAWKRTLTLLLSLEGRGDPFARSRFQLLQPANIFRRRYSACCSRVPAGRERVAHRATATKDRDLTIAKAVFTTADRLRAWHFSGLLLKSAAARKNIYYD